MSANRRCLVIPTPIGPLALNDQREGSIQYRPNSIVVGHAVGLSQNKGRKAMVVHVPAFAIDIEQAGGLGVCEHIIERPLQNRAVFAAAGGVAIRHISQDSHAHDAKVFGTPIAVRSLGLREVFKPSFKG